MRPLVLLLLATAALLVGPSATLGAEADAWPSTLLESGASALGSALFTPTPRNRIERLQQAANLRKQPQALGDGSSAQLFPSFPADTAGGVGSSPAMQNEHAGRAKEPQMDVYAGNHGAASKPAEVPAPAGSNSSSPAEGSAPGARAKRKTCGTKDNPCAPGEGPMPPPPMDVPIPPAAPLPPAPAKAEPPRFQPYPAAPADELPLATPPAPSCGEACDPDAKDPFLARVPAPPLSDLSVAAVGLEGDVLAAVTKKISNREGWLRAQKLWLSKAVEAAATVKREIELAEMTKAAVANDLEQLKKAQDALSIKYKADRLKWAYKDKKETLTQLHERLEALAQAKADVAHQIQEDKMEVDVLTSTLGPASEQVQISPEELEQPLKFLEDLHLEENYGKI